MPCSALLFTILLPLFLSSTVTVNTTQLYFSTAGNIIIVNLKNEANFSATKKLSANARVCQKAVFTILLLQNRKVVRDTLCFKTHPSQRVAIMFLLKVSSCASKLRNVVSHNFFFITKSQAKSHQHDH